MSKYIITGLDLSKNNAGPKARTDINYYLRQMGYQDLQSFDFSHSFLHLRKQKMIWNDIPQALKKLRGKDATVIFQYPIYSKVCMRRLLKLTQKNIAHFYVIVHDLESLRIFKDRYGFQKFEVDFFNGTNGIIVHNDHMKRALIQMGVKVPIISLEIFDYYTAVPLNRQRDNHQGIAFAGNLVKAAFLDKWDLKQSINLYGPHKHLHYPQNVIYKGTFSPEELPLHLKESFGLVWDGNRLDECNGMYGEYLKYNNPHKTSLYLSSGIPVIVWKQSAMSEFVSKYNVGLSVNDLHELETILPSLSDEKYAQMQQNAVAMAQKLRAGYFIKKAVAQLTT